MPGFLDIPAELRNRIYELSLTHDRAKGRLANVALLRDNKQVNQETRKMLPARVESFTIRVDTSSEPMTISGDMVNRHPKPVVFPAIMFRVPQVNIEFGHRDIPYYASHPKSLRRFIIQLSRALDQANNEHGLLRVRVRLCRRINARRYTAFDTEMLQPLYAMGRKKKIERVNF